MRISGKSPSVPRVAVSAALALSLLGAGGALAASGEQATPVPWAQSLTRVDRTTTWDLVSRTTLDFDAFHPQGFALVGDRIFMSSVEILEPPVKYPSPVGGYDRSTGRGVGHVFVMTREGRLIKDIVVGEGTMYHPGGIDFDGESVWAPVAEYRPNSKSVVYRIDPDSLKVREAFRYDDHVGGVVRDQDSGLVHGVSWGSRRLYAWRPDGQLVERTANPDHMLDYQDCAFSGAATQVCTGVTGLPTATGGSYELGGFALTSLRDDRVLHEVPFPRFSTAGHVATRNPVAFEQDGDTLRMFAAPDDSGEAAGTELLVYEARPGQ